MKKIALILLISIYSLATLGVSLKGFYCCGNLKSVSIALTGKTTQKGGKGNGQDGCCKTSYQFFKVNEKHIAADGINSPVNHSTLVHFFIIAFYQASFLPSQSPDVANGSHAPPLYNGVPVYLSNRIFRI